MNKIVNWLGKFDLGIILPAGFLVSIGLIVQSSIEYKIVGVDLEISLITQLLAIAAGIVLGLIALFFRLSTWRKFARYFFIITILLLVLVVVEGSSGGGAQRWLQVGPLQLQPTEIAKVSLILILANLFNTHHLRANSMRVLLSSMAAFLLPAALIVLQPDLGSAIVLGVVWLSMLFASKIKLSRFAIIIILIVSAVLFMLPFLAEYQQERLVSYFNPSKDTSGASYNVNQSQIAIGSGGFFGNGLEGGSQSQLNFLPSQHTDFIFSVVAEKLGLLGAGLVLLALIALLSRLLYLAYKVRSQYKRLIYIGIFSLLAFHSLVNIGMTMGLVPVTGLPLPYLSYGGTFMTAVVASTVIAARLQKTGD